MQALLYTSCSGKKAFPSGAEARQRPSPLSLAPLASSPKGGAIGRPVRPTRDE